MFRSYFKIGFRSLIKNKVYTFINVAGLSIGIACFILIAIYVRHETGYDTEFANASKIYRINTHVDVNGISNHYPAAHYPAAFDMVDDYPEVVNATTLYRAFYLSNVLPKIRYGDEVFEEEKFYLADSSFFSVFNFEFKYGTPEHAFDNSYSVVLTEETARKYFGDENPMGKMIQFQDTTAFKVTGVLKPHGKTHLDFDFLAHSKLMLNQLIGFRVDHAYLGLWYYSYVVLREGSSPAALVSKLPAFVRKYYPPRYTENNARLTIQNIRDIHLYSDFTVADMSVNGNIGYVYTLGSIAVLVLLIACVNFMNLSIARYSNRGKEVGVRKVMGAEKQNLVMQFLGESILVALIAGVFSILLVLLAVPVFNDLAGVQLGAIELLNAPTLAAAVAIMVGTGTLAGLYPAFVMAAFQPVRVLKGLHKSVGSKVNLRKVLVVGQFAVSLILLMGTLVISEQLGFMRNKSMGFDKEQIVTIPVGRVSTMRRDYPTFKNKLSALSSVKSVTTISHDIGQEALPYFPMKVEGMQDEQMLPIMYVGYDFLETFGISMSRGRFFNIQNPSDSTLAFVINESAAKGLNWGEPIGRKISFGVGGNENSEVIGVVNDFNFDPLRTKVGPLVIAFSPAQGNIAVKTNAGSYQQSIADITDAWTAMFPEVPFAHTLLNDALDKTYETEERLADVFTYFCALAIFVACLGLFALASFSAEQRLKEIGVRKVLGASETGLVLLLYKEFIILIVVAFVIASPLAYYFFDRWLDSFAYRIDIGPLTFLIAMAAIAAIAFITIGYQSINAARTNPVKVLRAE
ncbi:ABC transporter permease [Chryseolinea sp. T2]|uniref:ABC transporter permease n=1 Tax=Chryseolinea sp. T2 TaxID=3129255 RepID=UPI003077EC8F